MRQPPAHVARGRLVGAWTTALLAAAATAALASPALGHDVLVGTDPADGAVLDAAPTEVVLTFSAEQAGVGAEVAVTGPDGASWTDGPAVVDRTTVTQPLADGMPDGAYTVAWRSVAQDGHPVTGAFGFTLDAPDGGPEDTEPADDGDGTATDEPGTEPADEPSAAPSETTTAATAPDDEAPGGWTGWHTAAVAAAALLAMAVALVLRRPRRG